jgi:hypothetical protein
MSSGSNEVEASMDSEITLLVSLRLLFLPHVRLVLVIDKVDYWSPRFAVVDVVSETGGVDNGEFDLESLFFEFCFDDLDL